MSQAKSPSRMLALLALALALVPNHGDTSVETAHAHSEDRGHPGAGVAVRPELAPVPVAEPEHGPACADRIERALSEASEPGTPKLDQNRGVVLLYAKAEPVLFT